MKITQTLIAVILYTTITLLSCNSKNNGLLTSADVVIYGGTSAGISAAIQTARLGKSVILIEPTNRLGGLTTGGLGQTDIGNKQVIGGIAREFYQNISRYYEDSANWAWQMRSEYMDRGQTRSDKNEDAMWTFEPSSALKVFHDHAKAKFDLITHRYPHRRSCNPHIIPIGFKPDVGVIIHLDDLGNHSTEYIRSC